MSHISKGMSKNYPFMYQDVFNGVVDAVQKNGLTLKSKNLNVGKIVASTGVSMFSWGEDIEIYVKKIDEKNSSVSVHSELKMALNFAAGHRHEENFQKITDALSFYLQRNNCKSDSYESNTSLGDEIVKRDLFYTFFYRNMKAYRSLLEAEGFSVKKIEMFMSLYDCFLLFAVGVKKSDSYGQELFGVLSDDKVLFHAYLYVYHTALSLLAEHIKEPKLSETMAPFVLVAIAYASHNKKNEGHKKTLGGVLNPVADISNTDTMKDFKYLLRGYGSCDTKEEASKKFLSNVFDVWRDDESVFDEVLSIMQYLEDKDKSPSIYFEDYMKSIPTIVENILIKGLG